MSNHSNVVSIDQRTSNLYPIMMIGGLFFIFGFITWLNSILIPYLKLACELTNMELYFVAFAFYIAYFVMAIPSGWILKRIGFKVGMTAGLAIMAVGTILFIPAALTREYVVFLFGLFVQGTGLALLQTASNPYITILGPIESAAKRISIMGICNKVAGAVAPIILGAIVLSDADSLSSSLSGMDAGEKTRALNDLAQRVIFPYEIITASLLVLAALVYFSRLPDVKEDDATDSASKHDSIFRYTNLWFGVACIFFYVGVEVLAGDSIISYAASQQIPFTTAKFFTAVTLSTMIVGYLLGIVLIPKVLSQEKALLYSGVLGILLSIVCMLTTGYISVLAIAALGLANALVWPAIWPIALNGLGRFTKLGSSLLIMGIAGGAIIPLIYGRLADTINPTAAYIILIPCYLVILLYAVWSKRNHL